MFSIVLDVAIGMIFIYLLLSLMCSAANEVIELLLKKRAIDLERGIRGMLAPGSKPVKPVKPGEPVTEDIVQKLYDHALINNLFDKTYQTSRITSWFRFIFRTRLPSYIPARSFALALMDLVGKTPDSTTSGTTGSTPPTNFELKLDAPPSAPPAPGTDTNLLTPLRKGIAASPLLAPVPNVREGLLALVDAAGNDVAKARENIETWFNTSMDRVAGSYKRRTQVVILILGLLLAVAMNADSLAIAKKLSTDKALRDSLVAASVEYAKAHASPTATENSASQTQTGADKTAAGSGQPGAPASPSPKPSPAASPTPTPCPSPAPTPLPVKLPDSCKDLTSEQCKKDFPALFPGLNDCKDSDSEVCKALASECLKDPKSQACIQARVLVTLPECVTDRDSWACKEKALVKSIPACTECKPGKDPKESPQCKLELNQRQLESLNLPIGWGSVDDPQRKWPGRDLSGPGGWFDQLYWHSLGWLLTALAISLGAPFWFDLLNKFIVIRSAVKPHEKSPEEESKD